MDITQINQAVAGLHEAFQAIQQPRSDFALAHFVVGDKDTEATQYAQCVLELQIKYNAIRRSQISEKKLSLEIERLRLEGDEIKALDAATKEIDLEDLKLAQAGAIREFECLYRIFESFPHQFTYEEIQADQSEYWRSRLLRQADSDVMSSGRIGPGNLDALRQIGATVSVRSDGKVEALFSGIETPAQLTCGD